MPRTPDEFAVHIMLSGGHREEVRFLTIKEFQKWYAGEVVPKHDSPNFINVPMKTAQGEYLVVRPVNIIAIRVEPIYSGSVDRSF